MSTKLCAEKLADIKLTSELQSTYIAMNVIDGVCIFVAVAGNLAMILAILRNSSLRHNPSFMLVFNLAVSDVGVGLICMPLSIALTALEGTKDFELSCSKLSVAFKSTAGCLAVLSFLTITAISFDRFLAVHLKLNYRSVVTMKRMKIVISLLWFVAILSGMTYALDFTYFLVISSTIVCMCLILTTFNYLAIARSLYSHSAQLNARTRETDSSNLPKTFNLGQYKKTLKSMLYVYGAFLICYLPYLCCTITLKTIGRTRTTYIAYLATGTLVLVNSAINPCLYYWRITELRIAVQKLLWLNCLVRKKTTHAFVTKSESVL